MTTASIRRHAPAVTVWAASLALAAVSSIQSIDRYRDFKSGWPWDLGYNNQWFWSLLHADARLTICPVNSWGNEGPSIWKRTHLDPIRLGVIPLYAIWPAPESLLIYQNAILWLTVPAAFGLLRSEGASARLALAGAALVPVTPLFWPMLWNDFREMELGLPFALMAVRGFRERSAWPAAAGAAGMLASREEFGIMLATFALIPPRRPEPIATTYAWARWAVYAGVAWVAFAFFGYEWWFVASRAPEQYLAHLAAPKPGPLPTAREAALLLLVGAGPWAILALAAPRMAILILPWAWGSASGRWLLHEIGGYRWGSVRYAAPMLAMAIAAGLIGLAALHRRLGPMPRGRARLAAAWASILVGFGLADAEVARRFGRIEWPIGRDEAAVVRAWIDKVGPDEGVISAFEVCAPLSSRRLIHSNRLAMSQAKNYPRVGPEYHWAFLLATDPEGPSLVAAGFERAYSGPAIQVYRRPGAGR